MTIIEARLLTAAALSTLLGVGSELGANNNNNNNAIVQALRQGSANSMNQTGEQVVGRNLNIQPTIIIRPGFPVRVIINRDLVWRLIERERKGMMKLKLTAIPDDKPVKLSVELPASVHRDLAAYADTLGRQTGQKLEPAKLIAPMLARFMATDRALLRRGGKNRLAKMLPLALINPGASIRPRVSATFSAAQQFAPRSRISGSLA